MSTDSTPPSDSTPSSTPSSIGGNSVPSERQDSVSGKPPLHPNKRKKRSEVWDHFTVFEDEDGQRKGQCNYCPKSYFCDPKRNGTTSLKSHMNSCLNSPLRSDKTQSQIVLKPGDDKSVGVITWKFDPVLARKKLVEMIIKDEYAFSMVEGEGFIEFVGVICPKFKIPSRWTISRDVFQLYLDEKVKLRDFFRNSGTTVCITTDTWTSMQKANYMCITAHYIDKRWNLNKKIIQFCPVESHKGEEMGRQIDGCLREWGIARVLAITVDNASSNDTCVDYLRGRLTNRGRDVVKGQHLHMRCVAHILNLIVGEGLKVINPSIKKVRDTIRFVRNSPARLNRWKECCAEENIECKSGLSLDVPTRWNSTYTMLSVAVKFEKAFERFELEDPHFRLHLSADENSGVPTPHDWDIARRISDILSVFYEVTLKVSASLHVTSNLAHHEIDTVGNLLREWVNTSVDVNCPFVSEMGQKMQIKFEKYWGDATKMNQLVYLAVVLDPRYKFKFISFFFNDEYGEEQGSRLVFRLRVVLNDLFEFYKKLHQPQSESPSISQSSTGSQSSQSTVINLSDSADSRPQKKARYERRDRFKRFEEESGENLMNKSELDTYLDEARHCSDDDFEILKWWDVHQCRFPILSLVARDVLAMPISTVSSESAFSTGGRVLDSFRSSLSPKIVEGLICVQNWLRRSKTPIDFEEDLMSIEKHEEGISTIGKEKEDQGSEMIHE